jgi:hypothetical protein
MEGSVSKKKKKSSLPLLAGLLIVLGLIAFAVADPLHLLRPSDAQQAAQDPTRRVLIDAKAEELTAFEIKPVDADAFRLHKEKDGWYVTVDGKRSRADMERVDQLLKELPGLRSDSLVTENDKLYTDMEVGEGQGVELKVYKTGDQKVATLLVGKAAPGYQNSFVRLDGGKEVWSAATNVKSLVAFSGQDYRTKKPWSFKPETATKLTIQKFVAATEDEKTKNTLPPAPGPKLTFELKDGLWKRAGSGSNANQNAIKEFLKSFAELQMSEYLEPADPAVTKLAGREPAITVESPEGKLTLTLGARDPSYWYVSDQDGVVYKISDHTLNFYKELDWEKLTFDDAAKAAAQPEKDKPAEPKPGG